MACCGLPVNPPHLPDRDRGRWCDGPTIPRERHELLHRHREHRASVNQKGGGIGIECYCQRQGEDLTRARRSASSLLLCHCCLRRSCIIFADFADNGKSYSTDVVHILLKETSHDSHRKMAYIGECPWYQLCLSVLKASISSAKLS